MQTLSPTTTRYVFLDALRGFALLGICLANFPEFSLYNFQPSEVVSSMPSAGVDKVFQGLLSFFVDGKFYTIFSVLFGIGFSLIIGNAQKKGLNGKRIFYRRMIGLTVIGLLHLLLLWSGDILLLYALMGMLLPLFFDLSDRKLLLWSGFFLLLPIVFDVVQFALGSTLSQFAYDAWWRKCDTYGITAANFGTWLRDASSYSDMHKFLMQGAIERLWEFVEGNRYFKVLGLFLFGVFLGRKKVYARLDELKPLIKKVFLWSLAVAVPFSVLYTLSGTGIIVVEKFVRTIFYTFGVYSQGIVYCSGLALLYLKTENSGIWRFLAASGRMALTNYIFQSVFGVVIFYGIGFGLGAGVGLSLTLAIALGVFLLECLLSRLWLRGFRFGPLEWLWRMWTYGKYLSIRKKE